LPQEWLPYFRNTAANAPYDIPAVTMGVDMRTVRGRAHRTTTPNASTQPNDLASGTRKDVFGGVGTKFFCGELEEVEKGFLFRRIRRCATLVGRAAHKSVKSRTCRAFLSNMLLVLVVVWCVLCDLAGVEQGFSSKLLPVLLELLLVLRIEEKFGPILLAGMATRNKTDLERLLSFLSLKTICRCKKSVLWTSRRMHQTTKTKTGAWKKHMLLRPMVER
jgi:hypothetical protein